MKSISIFVLNFFSFFFSSLFCSRTAIASSILWSTCKTKSNKYQNKLLLYEYYHHVHYYYYYYHESKLQCVTSKIWWRTLKAQPGQHFHSDRDTAAVERSYFMASSGQRFMTWYFVHDLRVNKNEKWYRARKPHG